MRTIGWLLSFALWGTVTQTVNFDSAKPGSVPPGWTVTPHAGKAPQWEIRTDPSAPSPPYVFAEISRHAAADAAGDPCPLAILNKTTVKDGDLSVKVKPVAGKEDRAGGLVFRYRDPDNYYLVRANALENSILLYKVEDGKRIPLASRGAPPNSFGVKHPVPLNKCNSGVPCSASISITGGCSRCSTPPSASPARWGCGPEPTASLTSTTSALRVSRPFSWLCSL